MAIVWAFRIGIMIAPAAFRWAATGGSPPTQGFTLWLQQNFHRYLDPAEDPDVLTSEWQSTLPEGSYVVVTDFSAPFETRKLSVRWTRSPASLVAEDVDVIGMQFLKAPGGTPTNSWDTSDYTTLETAFGSLWNTMKAYAPSYQVLSEYRWYADGPAFHPAPSGGNPARRVTSLSVAGSISDTTGILPPQIAESVTFKTAIRKHWGRVYFPALSVNYVTHDGVFSSGTVDTLAAAFVTFFNAARAADLLPVVYSQTANIATTIDSIQVDNLFDVIRRRRWKRAGYKKLTALT